MASFYWKYRKLHALNRQSHLLKAWYTFRKKLPRILVISSLAILPAGLSAASYFMIVAIIHAIAGGPIIVGTATAAFFINFAVIIVAMLIGAGLAAVATFFLNKWAERCSRNARPYYDPIISKLDLECVFLEEFLLSLYINTHFGNSKQFLRPVELNSDILDVFLRVLRNLPSGKTVRLISLGNISDAELSKIFIEMPESLDLLVNLLVNLPADEVRVNSLRTVCALFHDTDQMSEVRRLVPADILGVVSGLMVGPSAVAAIREAVEPAWFIDDSPGLSHLNLN